MSDIPRSGLVTACSVCGRRINTIEWTAQNGEPSWEWIHGDPADHDPVPAPSDLSEVDRQCDFCLTPDPIWAFATENRIAVVMTTEKDTFTHHEDGYWSACTPCKRLVVDRDLDRLLHRGMIPIRRIWEDDPTFIKVAKTELRDYYRAFFQTQPGEPERTDP